MKKSFLVLFVVIPVVFLAVAVSNAAESLKIGLMVPLTGRAAAWGVGFKQGTELAIEEINKGGGIKVNGKTYLLKMIAEDSKFKEEATVAAANKLIFRDKVKFVIGPLCGGCNLIVGSVSTENKVIFFGNSYEPKAIGPDKPYFFRMVTTYAEKDPPLYSWIAKNYPNLKRLALLARNDSSGAVAVKVGKACAEKYGLNVVFEEKYAFGTKDYHPILTKLLAEKADLIDFCAGSHGDVGLIIKQARELGWKGTGFSSALLNHDVLIKVAGVDAVNGTMFAGAFFGEPWVSPETKQFAEAYVAKYGGTFAKIKSSAVYPYDAVHYLKKAILKVNSLDTTKIKDALEKMELDTIYGKARFGGGKRYGLGHQIIIPTPIVQIQKGKPAMIGMAAAVE